MPNAPNYELAENDYMSGMKYKDIARKYGVTLNTVKSWKKRYNWDRKGVHTKNEKVCTQKQSIKSDRICIAKYGTNREATAFLFVFCKMF